MVGEELPLQGALPTNRGAPVVTRPAVRAFWASFYAMAVFLLLLSVPSLGRLTPQAIVVQVLVLLWALAIALHGGKKKAEYIVAGVAIFIFWIPLGIHVLHQLYLGATGAGRAADGSLNRYLMGLLFSLVLFLPLTLLAGLFVVGKPWRKP